MNRHDEDKLKAIAQDGNVGGPEVGSVWRHYKGGLYVVVARSIKEDTLEPLVTYRSNARGTFWTRTLANFMEELPFAANDPDAAFPRFHREED